MESIKILLIENFYWTRWVALVCFGFAMTSFYVNGKWWRWILGTVPATLGAVFVYGEIGLFTAVLLGFPVGIIAVFMALNDMKE